MTRVWFRGGPLADSEADWPDPLPGTYRVPDKPLRNKLPDSPIRPTEALYTLMRHPATRKPSLDELGRAHYVYTRTDQVHHEDQAATVVAISPGT